MMITSRYLEVATYYDEFTPHVEAIRLKGWYHFHKLYYAEKLHYVI